MLESSGENTSLIYLENNTRLIIDFFGNGSGQDKRNDNGNGIFCEAKLVVGRFFEIQLR